MMVAAARFDSWGFDAPPRPARARSGRIVEAVARSVDTQQESPPSKALMVAVVPAVQRALPVPAQGCAAYRAMSAFSLCGLGRLIDDAA